MSESEQHLPSQTLLTTEQVAARLGVKASWVRQLVGQGRLTPLATGLRAHLFTPEVVTAFELADKPRRGRPNNK